MAGAEAQASKRDAHLTQVLNKWSPGGNLTKKAAEAKVLVVGAGGIGCELLKVLVLSGFKSIEVVDLDTIDVSNLNRQFLFRRHHVGKSKAEIAAEAVKRFNKSAVLTPHRANIKDKQFGADFMRGFDLIFNALDNIEARRHVNRVCVSVEKPLIDGGTQGYDGQVTTIWKGKSACYDCEPKPAPKGFPVCTIRSTPDKPIHCIVWGKHLFSVLFGVKDDVNAVSEVTSDMEAKQVLKQLFVADIEKLIGMEDLWKTRSPPTALDIDALLPAASAPEIERGSLDDREVWSLEQTAGLFWQSFEGLVARSKEAGAQEFDKDDDLAVDFVLCASNLRSKAFGIEMQTVFRCKEIAGNIIPAIATTNAIIAGAMVLEALKILDGRLADCRTFYKLREPSGRKAQILIPSGLDDPKPNCPVCNVDAAAMLTINVHKTPFSFFLNRVLKQDLGFNEPNIDVGDNFIECLNKYEDPSEQREAEARLPQPLSHPAIGIAHQGSIRVEDETQDSKLEILVTHSDEMDPEGEKTYTLERQSSATRSSAAPAGEAVPQEAGDGAVVEEDDDEVVMLSEDGTAEVEVTGGGKRGREEGGGGEESTVKRAKV